MLAVVEVADHFRNLTAFITHECEVGCPLWREESSAAAGTQLRFVALGVRNPQPSVSPFDVQCIARIRKLILTEIIFKTAKHAEIDGTLAPQDNIKSDGSTTAWCLPN